MSRNAASPAAGPGPGAGAGWARAGAATRAAAPARTLRRNGFRPRPRSGADRIFVALGQQENADDDRDDDRQRQQEAAADLIALDRLGLRRNLGGDGGRGGLRSRGSRRGGQRDRGK